MNAINELQWLALSYQIYPCDREVVIRAHFDLDLYNEEYIEGHGPDVIRAAADCVARSREHRNGRPRLVSITVISGLDREAVA